MTVNFTVILFFFTVLKLGSAVKCATTATTSIPTSTSTDYDCMGCKHTRWYKECFKSHKMLLFNYGCDLKLLCIPAWVFSTFSTLFHYVLLLPISSQTFHYSPWSFQVQPGFWLIPPKWQYAPVPLHLTIRLCVSMCLFFGAILLHLNTLKPSTALIKKNQTLPNTCGSLQRRQFGHYKVFSEPYSVSPSPQSSFKECSNRAMRERMFSVQAN